MMKEKVELGFLCTYIQLWNSVFGPDPYFIAGSDAALKSGGCLCGPDGTTKRWRSRMCEYGEEDEVVETN